MQISLNGRPHPCLPDTNVAQLLEQAGFADRRVAVEVNRAIVPHSRHAQHVLTEGDQVEIVHAIGGG